MKSFTRSVFLIKKTKTVIMCLVLFCALTMQSLQSKAQDSLHLFSVTYIKLKDPSYAKQYESMLNYYSKKVAEYGINAGKIQGWLFFKKIMPVGTSSDYDYEVVIYSNNLTTLLDDTAAIMKKAMPDMSDDLLKSINDQFNNLRYIVKREVYTSLDAINSATAPKYIEVDYMKPAAGKFSDYLKSEMGTWKPVHQERIKLGALSGWEIDEKVLPAGDKEDYDIVTANFYDSLPMMLDSKYAQAFKTVWPKMDINKVGTDVGNMRTMVKSDLLKLILAVDANTMKQ